MDRIDTPALDQAAGASAQAYADSGAMAGSVPHTFAVIGAHGPDALQAVLREISLAIALTTSANVFNRSNNTALDFPGVNKEAPSCVP
ncbi:MAG: hypothetical protein V4754_17065 [Pseudomonadota bacterium]